MGGELFTQLIGFHPKSALYPAIICSKTLKKASKGDLHGMDFSSDDL
jgi:hypothetical protein